MINDGKDLRIHEQSLHTDSNRVDTHTESTHFGRDNSGFDKHPGRQSGKVDRPGVWPWLIGAAALLALVSSVNSAMRGIQSSLASTSMDVLVRHTTGARHTAPNLTIDGRDVILNGKINTATNRKQLVAELRALEGVRVVLDDMQEFNPSKQVKIDQHAFKRSVEQIDASSVSFEPGNAALSSTSDPALDKIALLLRSQPLRQIKIAGHTDNSGNAQVNLKISRQRAQSVADSLIVKGVEEEQLIVQGFGHTRPLFSNDTEAGRSKNRRIEFILMK